MVLGGRLTILLLLCFLVTLTGGGMPAAAEPSTLHMGVESLGLHVDPHIAGNLSSRNLLTHLYEGLVARRADLDLEPSLAQAWTAQPDGSWRFDLRPGVRFHNGGRLDATDVVYSLCRILSLPASPLAPAVRQLSAVESAGADQVVIRSDLPAVDVPRQMAGLWIMDAPPGWNGHFHPAGCSGMAATRPFTDPGLSNGTGPYRLTQFQVGTVAVLDRFAGYWGVTPPWDRVEMAEIADTAQRSRALVVGDVAVIDMVPAESAAYLRGRPDIDLVVGPVSRTFQMQMNQRPAGPGRTNPFTDARVRRALSLAIDRTAIIGRTLAIGALPTTQLLPAGMDGHQTDLPDDPFNPDLARQALRDAGYADGFDTTILVQDYATRFAQAIARYLQQVGVRAEVVTLGEGELVSRITRGDFQLYIGSINLFAGDYVMLTRNLLASDKVPTGQGAYNRGGFSNGQVDALIGDLLQRAPDAPDRPVLYRRLATLAYQEMPMIPLAHAGRMWAVRHSLTYAGRVDGLTLAMEIVPTIR